MKVKEYLVVLANGEVRIMRGTFKGICKELKGEKAEITRLSRQKARELEQAAVSLA